MQVSTIIVLVGTVVTVVGGCQQQNHEPRQVTVPVMGTFEPYGVRQDAATDVESVLKSGRWEKRAGLGRGMSWQYLDGGRVKIYDGSEINEAYKWEVISRNEAERKIKIRYWKSADTTNEHREFVFKFSPDGDSAEVENWLRKNGQIEWRDESTQYRVR